MSNKIDLEFNENFKGGTVLGNFFLRNQVSSTPGQNMYYGTEAPTPGQNIYNYEFPTQTPGQNMYYGTEAPTPGQNMNYGTEAPTLPAPTSTSIQKSEIMTPVFSYDPDNNQIFKNGYAFDGYSNFYEEAEVGAIKYLEYCNDVLEFLLKQKKKYFRNVGLHS